MFRNFETVCAKVKKNVQNSVIYIQVRISIFGLVYSYMNGYDMLRRPPSLNFLPLVCHKLPAYWHETSK